MRLEHIGIVVSDITEARTTFSSLLGSKPYKIESVESEKVSTHFLWAGGVKIELLEATHADSVIQKFLEKRGEGLHHLAFNVDSLSDAAKSLTEAGFVVLGDGPKDGADGKSIFFIHPKSAHSVLIECCERSDTGPNPVEFEAVGGVEVSRFGSEENPAVLIVPGSGPVPAKSRHSFAQLLDRLEPTHNVFRLVRSRSQKEATLTNTNTPGKTDDSAILKRLLNSRFDVITIGSSALALAEDILRGGGNTASTWIHIVLGSDPQMHPSKHPAVTHIITSDSSVSQAELSPAINCSVLPRAAMNPADPEHDALVPLVKSLLRH